MTRRSGADHPNAKLTYEQVDAIRKSRMGPSELARIHGVSKATISLIKRGKLWPETPTADLAKSVAAPAPVPQRRRRTSMTRLTI